LFERYRFAIRGTTMFGTVRIDSVTKLAKIAPPSIDLFLATVLEAQRLPGADFIVTPALPRDR
jgi:hypothetical protein